MEEKEIVRKSVPIPKKWLKELLDFLGIEEDRYLAWILFPHECNDVLGFLFSEDRAKEMVREIYHPTEKELKQEDEWEKELIEEVGYSKMDFWKEVMTMYPLHQFAYWKNALDPLTGSPETSFPIKSGVWMLTDVSGSSISATTNPACTP